MSTALLLPFLLLAPPRQSVSLCCGMGQFANDPEFLAMHLTPVAIHFTPKDGKTVTYKDSDGKETSGFYVPPKPGSKGAVIMVHEFWGLNDNIRNTAEWLNNTAGYGVLAVDLYDGKVTTDAKTAGGYMQGVDEEHCKAIVKGAVWALKHGDIDGFKAAKIGAVGFCLGGGWSFQTAVQGGKDVNACSVFYGMPDTSDAALDAIQAPVIFNQATKDKWITAEVAANLATKMKEHHKKIAVYHYDADHAFANPSNPHYNKQATDLAWDRTLKLFKKYLG